jgi:putative mRNA 3-end processing factor
MRSIVNWLVKKDQGLFCIPGDFYIDPTVQVSHAVISHAHADHVCAESHTIIASPETIAFIEIRHRKKLSQAVALNDYQKYNINGVEIYLVPSGHILGSNQIVLEYQNTRVVYTGDFKRSPDPTCKPFNLVSCDLLITESTFGLPVFQHPPIEKELEKLLESQVIFSDYCHLIGVYPLGKCQRIIKTLRNIGVHDTFYVHPSMRDICQFYQEQGVDLGSIEVTEDLSKMAGHLVFTPPSALKSKWTRAVNVRFAFASGWMAIRARAKQKLIDLPLVISDHADWSELLSTIEEIKPKEIWVTHGEEEALTYLFNKRGIYTEPLHLVEHAEEQ